MAAEPHGRERAFHDGRHALTVLTRLAVRRPEQKADLARAFEGRLEELADPALEVAVEIGDPVGQVLATKVEDSGEYGLALRLVRFCEDDFFDSSVPLREVALAATQKSLDFLRAGRRDLLAPLFRRYPGGASASHLSLGPSASRRPMSGVAVSDPSWRIRGPTLSSLILPAALTTWV